MLLLLLSPLLTGMSIASIRASRTLGFGELVGFRLNRARNASVALGQGGKFRTIALDVKSALFNFDEDQVFNTGSR